MGYPPVYPGEEGPLGVQREPVHLDDDLQRVPPLHLPQRLHVSGAQSQGYFICIVQDRAQRNRRQFLEALVTSQCLVRG